MKKTKNKSDYRLFDKEFEKAKDDLFEAIAIICKEYNEKLKTLQNGINIHKIS
jgi:hypothetical protein